MGMRHQDGAPPASRAWSGGAGVLLSPARPERALLSLLAKLPTLQRALAHSPQVRGGSELQVLSLPQVSVTCAFSSV